MGHLVVEDSQNSYLSYLSGHQTNYNGMVGMWWSGPKPKRKRMELNCLGNFVMKKISLTEQ
jgi:hypothetical protein